jgi:hypothetical protein
MSVVPQSAGAIPVVYLDPPPEGYASANFACTLTPGQPNFAQTFPLNSPTGLNMSQVVSLFIDNQLNPLPVTLVHGALNEVTTVLANASVVIPTLSNKGGYPINASVPSGQLSQPMTFNIVFSNFMRHKASFNTVLSNSIAGVGNTQPITSTVATVTSTPTTNAWDTSIVLVGKGNLLPPDNRQFIMDSLDFAVEGFNPRVAGQVLAQLVIFVTPPGIPGQKFGTPICSGILNYNATGPGWISGVRAVKPIRNTYWNGMAFARDISIGFQTVGLLAGQDANLTSAVFRFNISGVFLP